MSPLEFIVYSALFAIAVGMWVYMMFAFVAVLFG